MGDPSDTALLEAARTGDEQSVEALIRRYQPRVHRFGLKMCRNPEDAEDVLQDTLLAMARSLRSFRGASSIATWLYSIARRFCIKKRRRRKGEPTTVGSLDAGAGGAAERVASPTRGPAQKADDQEIGRALDDAVAALAPKYREVLLLRDVEGLTAADVARVLKIGVPAVKSRLHRARLAVRERLAPLLVDDAPPSAAKTKQCRDVARLFSRHLEGEVESQVCARMERHLTDCDRCRVECDSLKATLALCSASPTPQVSPAVQRAVRDAVRAFVASAP